LFDIRLGIAAAAAGSANLCELKIEVSTSGLYLAFIIIAKLETTFLPAFSLRLT